MSSINKTQEYIAAFGKEGLLDKYKDFQSHHRLSIIKQSLNYGEEGINFLFSVLKDEQELPHIRNGVYDILLSKYGNLINYVNNYVKLPIREFRQEQLDIKKFTFETVTTNNKGEIVSSSQHSANYFIEDLGDGIKLEMVRIPEGKYVMGSGDQRCDWEFPEHKVNVKTFFMGKYPVTQEQYVAVTGKNPSTFQGDKLPVESISWNNAMSFCEELTKRTGKTYTLASEAQWEYACRAGTRSPFYFGESINTDLVNYNGNYSYGLVHKEKYRQKTVEVGLIPNAFGLYNMHGNVSEWCLDDWNSNYEGAPNDGSAWLNANSRWKVVRGGAWSTSPQDCRSASRGLNMADSSYNDIGFRLVFNP
jgi:formylglycine-generating enzyme required for sulfatase activity